MFEGGLVCKLIEVCEKVFWVVKVFGVDDIIDIVVLCVLMLKFLSIVCGLVVVVDGVVVGCGYVGDGNVYMVIVCKDLEKKKKFMIDIFVFVMELGGVIFGEYGVGWVKIGYFFELEDLVKISFMCCIK